VGGGNLGALQQVLAHASIVTTQRCARMSDEVVMHEAEWIGGVMAPANEAGGIR
jgi:hypothetical protein